MSPELKVVKALLVATGFLLMSGATDCIAQIPSGQGFVPPTGFQPMPQTPAAPSGGTAPTPPNPVAQAPTPTSDPFSNPSYNPYSNPSAPPLGLQRPPTGQPSPQTPQTGGDPQGSPSPQGSPTVPRAQTGSAAAILPYDPLVDNHLVSPELPIGLFGLPVSEVEEILQGYGAKPNSYAFGKYSRYILSVYELTLYFDRFRKLAGVDITPRPPFERVEVEAQKFFLQLFFQGKELSGFRATIQDKGLQLRYAPANSNASR